MKILDNLVFRWIKCLEEAKYNYQKKKFLKEKTK